MMYSRLATQSLPWILSLLLVTACTPTPLAPQAQTPPSTQNTMTAHTSQFKKGPYHGPVTLTVDTGLISGQTGKKVVIPSVSDDPDFQIQALPAGNVMFQASFIKALGQTLEQTRAISIADTSKRYTLHVQKDNIAGQVEVNINGTDWIKAQDFGLLGREAVNKTLLLQTHNTLRIRIRGLLRSQVTVTLVEGGEAGVVRKRQGKIGSLNETHADRVRQNDSNIFDPNQPDSLGGLQPYEGDEPELTQAGQHIGLISASQTQARLIIGELSVVVKEPVAANLQALQERFPVTIKQTDVSFGDTFATLAIELPQVQLNELPLHIQQLNQRPDYAILEEVTFSSVNAAKTLAVATAIQAQGNDLTYGANLVTLGEKHSTLVDFDEQAVQIPTNMRKPPPTTPPVVPTKASQLWWLNSIKAQEAWNYSLGESINVAVIDSNFGIIQENNEFEEGIKHVEASNHPNRITLAVSGRVSYLKENCPVQNGVVIETESCKLSDDQSLRSSKTLFNEPGHGLAVTSFLAAGQNNQQGIVGVAPETKILPMYVSASIKQGISQQLERLYNENVIVDVVNISMGEYANIFDLVLGSFDYYLEKVAQELGLPPFPTIPGNTDITRLVRVISKLTFERKVIFVASGGNKNKGYDPNGPSNQLLNYPSGLPFVIGVGGYENINGTLKRASFPYLEVGGGSDYGPLLKIWAPGKNMWNQNLILNESSINSGNPIYEPQWNYWEGTSHATPLVAGTVALMKSVNKNLTFEQVVQILQETGTPLTDSSFRPAGTNYPVYGLNSLAAITDSRVGGTAAATYTLKWTPNGLEDINNQVPGSGLVFGHNANTADRLQKLYPQLNNGDTVEFTGWSRKERNNIPENVLHIQKLQRVNPTGGGGFGTLAFNESPPGEGDIAEDQYIYDKTGNRWLRPGFQALVDANEFAGIRFNQPIRNLEVKIGPVLVPVVSVLRDLAVIGIPEDLPAGVHDVIVTASGQTLTLEQAVNKVSQAIPPTPEPSPPPSAAPGYYDRVGVYNIEGNDEGRVYINNELVLTARAGEPADYYLPEDMLHNHQRNEFRFEVINNGGGYTYGFYLFGNGQTVYRDEKGTPGEKNVQFNGQDDTTQGVVYNERFQTYRNFTPLGSGPYWIKMFNMNDDEEMDIYTNNELGDIQWQNGYFRMRGEYDEVSKQLPTHTHESDPICYGCWRRREYSFDFRNPEGPYNFGLEIYKGINLVYRNIQGQKGVWGASNNAINDSIYFPTISLVEYAHYSN